MNPNDALVEAAMRGEGEQAADALRQGADANYVFKGWPPLFWAAQEGHVEIVDLLLDAGANVNFTDPSGFTPLEQAVGESHLNVVERLLLRGADVSHRCATDGGCTVLHTAAAYGHVDCIRLLLQFGANANTRNDHRQTAYDKAVECAETGAAALLLASQAT
jgi:ankyrin repeat protein